MTEPSDPALLAQQLQEAQETITTLNNELSSLRAASQELARRVPKPRTAPSSEEIFESDSCPVCLEEYSMDLDMEQVHCGHEMCVDCFIPTIRQMHCCPVCRSPATALEEQRASDPLVEAKHYVLYGQQWPKVGDFVLVGYGLDSFYCGTILGWSMEFLRLSHRARTTRLEWKHISANWQLLRQRKGPTALANPLTPCTLR